MTIWELLGVICGCGAIGGIVNALLSEDRGLAWPKRVSVGDRSVWRPGFLGNIIIGAITAGLFWMLYGPYADTAVIGSTAESVVGRALEEEGEFGETLAGLAGAVLSGIAGARLLTATVDKKFFQEAASAAAENPPSADTAARISTASPSNALRLASNVPAE
jgi:hypothetical protein